MQNCQLNKGKNQLPSPLLPCYPSPNPPHWTLCLCSTCLAPPSWSRGLCGHHLLPRLKKSTLSGLCASFLVCLNPSNPGFYDPTVCITAPPVLKGPSISNIYVHNGFSCLYKLSQYHSVSTASPVCPIIHPVHSPVCPQTFAQQSLQKGSLPYHTNMDFTVGQQGQYHLVYNMYQAYNGFFLWLFSRFLISDWCCQAPFNGHSTNSQHAPWAHSALSNFCLTPNHCVSRDARGFY